jgi:hypothetical protein
VIEVLAAIAVAAGAMAQWVTGIGFALVCAPFLIALLGPEEGVKAAVALGIPLNVALLFAERRHFRPLDAALLLAPAVAVMPLMGAAVRRVNATALAAAAGSLTIIAALLLAVGLRARRVQGRGGAVAAAVVSAAMNTIAAIGGPAVALYALNAGWSPQATRAILQAYFLGLNIATLVVLGPSLPHFVLVVGLGVGLVAGRLVAGRVPVERARTATLAVAIAGGVTALVRAVI